MSLKRSQHPAVVAHQQRTAKRAKLEAEFWAMQGCEICHATPVDKNAEHPRCVYHPVLVITGKCMSCEEVLTRENQLDCGIDMCKDCWHTCDRCGEIDEYCTGAEDAPEIRCCTDCREAEEAEQESDSGTDSEEEAE